MPKALPVEVPEMNGEHDLGTAAFNELQDLRDRIERLEREMEELKGLVLKRGVAKTMEQLRREAGGE